MQLSAMKVTREKDTATQNVIGKTAVITDLETDAVELIQIDSVEIEQCAWARDLGVFQVQLALGGYDSNGTFHRDARYGLALVSWSRAQCKELWDKYGLESLSGLDFDTVKQWLHDENAVTVAGVNIWNLPQLESQLKDSGEIVADYKKNRKIGKVEDVGNP